MRKCWGYRYFTFCVRITNAFFRRVNTFWRQVEGQISIFVDRYFKEGSWNCRRREWLLNNNNFWVPIIQLLTFMCSKSPIVYDSVDSLIIRLLIYFISQTFILISIYYLFIVWYIGSLKVQIKENSWAFKLCTSCVTISYFAWFHFDEEIHIRH